MQKFFLEVGKIVGASSESCWSQVNEFIPSDNNKLFKRGQLVVALSIKSQDPDLIELGREVMTRVREEYYNSTEAPVEEHLESILKKVAQEFDELDTLEIEALVVLGNACFLAIFGPGKIFLKRNQKAALLLKGEENQISTTRGFLKDKDSFSLFSAKALEVVGEKQAYSLIMKPSVVEASDGLVAIIHSQKEDGLSAVSIIGVEENKDLNESVDNLRQIAGKTIDFPKENDVEAANLKPKKPGLENIKRALMLKRGSLKRSFSKIPRKLFSRSLERLEKREVYLNQSSGKKGFKKTFVSVGIVLLAMLLVSVALGSKQQENPIKKGISEKEILSQAKIKKDEAEALLILNPIKSKEILQNAEDLLGRIETEKYFKERDLLINDIQALLSKVSKEHIVSLNSILDLELIKDGAKMNAVALDDGLIYILDSDKQSIYSIELESQKNSLAVSGSYLSSASFIASSKTNIYCLTADGIVEIDKKTKKNIIVAKAADQPFKSIKDMVYYSQSLYLLDENQIYKYPIFEGILGSYRNWLKEETDLSGKKLAINGSVFVLSGSEVDLFISGNEERFTVSGLDHEFDNPISIYADQVQENIFVLDQENKRVVVLEEDGQYNSQYGWQEDVEIINFLVSKETQKIYLFGKSLIYTIDLEE
ncbi:MAG: hypothetical protein ABIH88_03530 [Patescibacteria group bacterium]|nr:hypothetical protein [Patescibacteria group bacterium]